MRSKLASVIASTGPRPRGRGMESQFQRRRMARTSFNGAAPARARNGLVALDVLDRRDMASTGPRPRGRGMASGQSGVSAAVSCFNGAAPARARNGMWYGLTPVEAVAVLQRGRARAGAECEYKMLRYHERRQLVLQRGRARAGAEWTIAAAGFKACGFVASTGPRPRGRGMGESPIRHASRDAAACFNGAAPARARNGRNPNVVFRSAKPRFNGAAPARARNGAGARPRRAPASLLQRGRARAGAEWAPEAVSVGRSEPPASTGPRPRGRGMDRRNGHPARPTMIASTGPRPRGRGMACDRRYWISREDWLQRGRARAGAEWFDPDASSRSTVLEASTGPRPRGRGMEFRQRQQTPSAASFNGAAPARARNGRHF